MIRAPLGVTSIFRTLVFFKPADMAVQNLTIVRHHMNMLTCTRLRNHTGNQPVV